MSGTDLSVFSHAIGTTLCMAVIVSWLVHTKDSKLNGGQSHCIVSHWVVGYCLEAFSLVQWSLTVVLGSVQKTEITAGEWAELKRTQIATNDFVMPSRHR